MKWPTEVTLIRHGQSTYNALRKTKARDADWIAFKAAYENDFGSLETRRLAEIVMEKFALGVSDYETPLTDKGIQQAQLTGKGLRERKTPLPDVVFYSPYKRTESTLAHLIDGWPALGTVIAVADDRIREQEHGLSLLYNDWRAFHVFYPEQKKLRDLLGPYWYQFPQGESISQVRDRIRSELSMLIREYAEKRVLFVTHHLTILSFLANVERLTPEEFILLDEKEKPINCGVTVYVGDRAKGKNGKLVLASYNKKLY
jgi:broad specificity phosphatase PhoE